VSHESPIAEQSPAPGGPPGGLAGYLDGVFNGRVMGWCCRPDDPEARLEVEAFVDGRSVGTATAAIERPSVAAAGFGDGRYGFAIALAAGLADGGEHRVAVRLGDHTLPPAPDFVSGRPREASDPAWTQTRFVPEPGRSPASTGDERPGAQGPVPGRHLAGYVDGIVADTLRGWVADPADPELSHPVEAFLDGVRIGASPADESRPDVARQGLGERHGFRIPIAPGLGPGSYELRVRTVRGARPVALAGGYAVLDADRRPVPGIELHSPPAGGDAPGRTSHALLGTGGWLFAWPGRFAFDTLRGARRLPGAALAHQLDRIHIRGELGRGADVRIVQAVVPDKLAVYAEHLPPGLDLVERDRPADRLAAALRDENDVDVLDLTLALRQAKDHGALFSATGSALTWRGGLHAYRAIAKELAKTLTELRPRPALDEALHTDQLEPVPDSLAALPRLVWLGDDTSLVGSAAGDEPREGRAALDWRRIAAEYVVPEPALTAQAGGHVAVLRRRQANRGRSLLLVHDGAAAALLPFLSDNFDELVIVGPDADVGGILALRRPAVVVEVLAESSLLR
jgi:hypothetical protein